MRRVSGGLTMYIPGILRYAEALFKVVLTDPGACLLHLQKGFYPRLGVSALLFMLNIYILYVIWGPYDLGAFWTRCYVVLSFCTCRSYDQANSLREVMVQV